MAGPQQPCEAAEAAAKHLKRRRGGDVGGGSYAANAVASTGSSAGVASQALPVAPEAEPAALAAALGRQSGINSCARARLLRLELEDFRLYERQDLELWNDSSGAVVVMGPNSCGKSSLLDALHFVLLRPLAFCLPNVIRRCAPDSAAARVTAHFAQDRRSVKLRREIGGAGDVGSAGCFWLSEGEGPMRSVSEEAYRSMLSDKLGWLDRDLLLPQFSFLGSLSAERLLKRLPEELARAGGPSGSPTDGRLGAAARPLLKRRGLAASTASAPRVATGAVAAQAWLSRRVDEIYHEMTREPLDEAMEQWGDGGQACLRRSADGSFTLNVSAQRGAAACGYGTPLASLSEGHRDLCALALLLTLPGLYSGQQDTLPPCVVLDEPDSRLDKRHAKALWRFLSGPQGPRQCLVLSLNNHGAFERGGPAFRELCVPPHGGSGPDDAGAPEVACRIDGVPRI